MFLLGLPQAVIGHMCSSCRGAHARVPHHSVARSRLGKLILARPENVFSPSSICCSAQAVAQPTGQSPSRETPKLWLLTSHFSFSCLDITPVIFFNLLFFNMYQLNISFLTPTCVFLTRAIMPFCCVLSMETEFHRSLFGYKRFTQNLPS